MRSDRRRCCRHGFPLSTSATSATITSTATRAGVSETATSLDRKPPAVADTAPRRRADAAAPKQRPIPLPMKSLRSDQRAQSIQIGAILFVAIALLALGLYQTHVVPAENQCVEAQAHQSAVDDMRQLQTEVLWSAHHSGPSQHTIQTGTRYPTGIVRLNPPPAAGSIRAHPLPKTAPQSSSRTRHWRQAHTTRRHVN